MLAKAEPAPKKVLVDLSEEHASENEVEDLICILEEHESENEVEDVISLLEE
jgi:hypothetical protein